MQPLLRSQKNEIFNALVLAGLDEGVISKIEWKYDAKKTYSLIKYDNYYRGHDDGSAIALILKQDGYTFFFYFNGLGNHWCYNGFPIGVGNGIVKNYNITWSSLIYKIINWAYKISSELKESDDLWEELSNIKSGYSYEYGEFEDNEPITAKEAESIRSKLTILEQKIIEKYGITDSYIKIIKEKFEYLDKGIERQGKKDWFHTLIGVLASLIIALGISAANSDGFWQIVKNVLNSPIKLLIGN
jgi:hypothetical protein